MEFFPKQQGMPMRPPQAGVPITGQPMMAPNMMPMGMPSQQQPMPVGMMMQPTMMQQPLSHDQNGGQNVKLDPFGAFQEQRKRKPNKKQKTFCHYAYTIIYGYFFVTFIRLWGEKNVIISYNEMVKTNEMQTNG